MTSFSPSPTNSTQFSLTSSMITSQPGLQNSNNMNSLNHNGVNASTVSTSLEDPSAAISAIARSLQESAASAVNQPTTESVEDEEVEDEEMDDEEEEEEVVSSPGLSDHFGDQATNTNSVVAKDDVRANLNWLNHQMRQVMIALGVSVCPCNDCKQTNPLGVKTVLANASHPGTHLPFSPNGGDLAGQAKFGGAQFPKVFPTVGVGKRGRKSKYCSPNEKKAVAQFAQLHGASAAARKFGIPPAVAAYYYRKEFKQPMPGTGGLPVQPPFAQARQNGTNDSSGDEKEAASLRDGQQQKEIHNGGSGDELGASAVLGGNTTDAFWSNGTHPSGTPGFLRGRGRGRPKLIGDELDAELVEWLVAFKQANLGQHMSAHQALMLARNYIMEKAPGLLEEHGGQVKLKVTWAMKLLVRVAEREREIQLGLPAGTLQNMSRGASNSGSNLAAGSALVNELMAQHLLNQQLANFTGAVDGLLGGSSAGAGVNDMAGPTAEQLLAELNASGGANIDSELFKTILGNLRAGLDGQEPSPSNAPAAPTSQSPSSAPPSNSTTAVSSTNEMLAQAAGAF